MFSCNGKISARQYERLLTLELFGVSTLLLPGILCKTAGRDGLISLMAGVALLAIMLWLAFLIIRRADGNMLSYTRKAIGKTGTDFVLVLLGLSTTLFGAFALVLCSELVQNVLLAETDRTVIRVCFFVLALYGTGKGMECRARMAEVSFWAFLLPFLSIIVLASGGIKKENFLPALITDSKSIWLGACEVLAVFQIVIFAVLALPYMQKKEMLISCVKKSVLWNVVLCAALFFIVAGVFGIKQGGSLPWPAISLMTTEGIYGGFVKRLDIFMITIWIFAFYFLLSGAMLYGTNLIHSLLETDEKRSVRYAAAALIFLTAEALQSRKQAYEYYRVYLLYIGIPAFVLILLLILIAGKIRTRKKRMKRGMFLFMIFGTILLCAGCGQQIGLEDRGFILGLGIDLEGEQLKVTYDLSDFYKEGSESGDEGGKESLQAVMNQAVELSDNFGEITDKYPDFNHLKAVVIGEDLAKNQEKFIELLQYFEKNEMFAQNVKLFVAENEAADIFADSNCDTSIGEYLENQYGQSGHFSRDFSCTIGDLLLHRSRYLSPILIPIVSKDTGNLQIDGYAVVNEVRMCDELSLEEGNLVFLGNGAKGKTRLLLEGDNIMKADRVKRTVECQNTEELFVLVSLDVKGRLINRSDSEKETKEMQKILSDRLNQQYEKFLSAHMEDKLDYFHTFEELSLQDKLIWLQYRENRKKYCLDMKLRVETNVKLSEE